MILFRRPGSRKGRVLFLPRPDRDGQSRRPEVKPALRRATPGIGLRQDPLELDGQSETVSNCGTSEVRTISNGAADSPASRRLVRAGRIPLGCRPVIRSRNSSDNTLDISPVPAWIVQLRDRRQPPAAIGRSGIEPRLPRRRYPAGQE